MPKLLLYVDQVRGLDLPRIDKLQVNNRDLRVMFEETNVEPIVKKSSTSLDPGPYSTGAAASLVDRNIPASAKAGEWTGQVFILDLIRHSTAAGTSEDCLGILINEPHRQAIAIAAKALEQQDRHAVYLRTVAHELGHLLNLLHPYDNRCPQRDDRATIMAVNREAVNNQSPDLVFHKEDLEWLTSAAVKYPEYVMPGGKPFKCRPSEYCSQRPAPRGPSPTFDFFLEAVVPTRMATNCPLFLNMKVGARGGRSLLVPGGLSLTQHQARVSIRRPGRNEFEHIEQPFYTCAPDKTIEVTENHSLTGKTQIFYDSQGPVFSEDGLYEIKASVDALQDGQAVRVESPTYHIQVSRGDEEIAGFLKEESLQRFVALRGGRDVESAAALAESLLKRKPDPMIEKEVRLALAAYYTEKEDHKEALELLDELPRNFLEHEYTAEAELLKYQAGRHLDQALGQRSLEEYRHSLGRVVSDEDEVERQIEYLA